MPSRKNTRIPLRIQPQKEKIPSVANYSALPNILKQLQPYEVTDIASKRAMPKWLWLNEDSNSVAAGLWVPANHIPEGSTPTYLVNVDGYPCRFQTVLDGGTDDYDILFTDPSPDIWFDDASTGGVAILDAGSALEFNGTAGKRGIGKFFFDGDLVDGWYFIQIKLDVTQVGTEDNHSFRINFLDSDLLVDITPTYQQVVNILGTTDSVRTDRIGRASCGAYQTVCILFEKNATAGKKPVKVWVAERGDTGGDYGSPPFGMKIVDYYDFTSGSTPQFGLLNGPATSNNITRVSRLDFLKLD